MGIVSMVQMKYERVLINTFYLLVAWHIKAKRNEHNVWGKGTEEFGAKILTQRVKSRGSTANIN